LFVPFTLRSQVLKIFDSTTGFPIEGVALFNQLRNKSTLSDKNGEAIIDGFDIADSIYFQHPSYVFVGYTKDRLIKKHLIVFLNKRFILLDEFVISASKSIERKRDIPHMIDVIKINQLSQSTSQTSADLLANTGNVIIQKSQGGGGSPIIRGFEANKILLVIDGVRMNNAIYRSGHLQNSITIDNSILERAEIIYGPTSIIYGSDALGGVIHYYTKDPTLSGEKKFIFKPNAYIQYSTANEGKVGHLDFNVGFKKFASLSSITIKDFGDIKTGKNREPFLEDFGKTKHYVSRINGTDSTMINPDPYIQKNTGYSQYDFMQKFIFSPSNKFDLIANIQYSTSSNIDRFDKLNDYKENNLKYAEWYYGPQNRLFTSLKSVIKKYNVLFTNFTTIVAFQKIDEDRITRKFSKDDCIHQEENLNIFSTNLDFLKITRNSNKINYGFEYNYNEVFSNAYYKNILDDSITLAQTRYPDGDSYTNTISGYFSYKWFLNRNYILYGGIRYSYAKLKSDFTNAFVNLPFSTVEIENGAVTGSLSLVYHPVEFWQFNLIASTGFRNPNVDDYGKIRAKDEYITIPNDKLEPEYSYNIEFGVSMTIDRYIKINGILFSTYLAKAIVRSDYQLNGSDSLFYDGDYYRIITNLNTNRAVVKGISLSVVSDFNSNLNFKSTFNYVHGKDISNDAPLGHIPPIFGRTTINYRVKKFDAEAYLVYNAWKKIEDFSPFGEDNESEATQYGYPDWCTVNARTTYRFNKNFQFQFAIENILDTYYKVFASGVSAPGRNFIFTIQTSL